MPPVENSPPWPVAALGSGPFPASFSLRCLRRSSTRETKPQRTATSKLEQFADGDTLLLASDERVRLIGIDTPETKHPKKPLERFGKEASEFTRHMVEGKRVRLELDPANAATSHKDNTPQKRTLAYVFLDDGRLLNAEIIKQGYGFALTRFSFSRMEEFRRLEHEAREQGEVVGGEVIGN